MQFKRQKQDENHSISILSCGALSPYKQPQTPNGYFSVLYFHEEKSGSADFTVMVHGAPSPLFLHSSLLSRTMGMVQNKASERWKFDSPHDMVLNEAWLSDMECLSWKVAWTYFSLYYGKVLTDFTVVNDSTNTNNANNNDNSNNNNASSCVHVNEQQNPERVIDFTSWKALLYMSDYFQDKTVSALLIKSLNAHLYGNSLSVTHFMGGELVLLLCRLLVQLYEESNTCYSCVEYAIIQFGDRNTSSHILGDRNYIALCRRKWSSISEQPDCLHDKYAQTCYVKDLLRLVQIERLTYERSEMRDALSALLFRLDSQTPESIVIDIACPRGISGDEERNCPPPWRGRGSSPYSNEKDQLSLEWKQQRLHYMWTAIFPDLPVEIESSVRVFGSVIPLCMADYKQPTFASAALLLFPGFDLNVLCDNQQTVDALLTYLHSLYPNHSSLDSVVTIMDEKEFFTHSMVLPMHPISTTGYFRVKLSRFSALHTKPLDERASELILHSSVCPVRAFYNPATRVLTALPSALLSWCTMQLRDCRSLFPKVPDSAKAHVQKWVQRLFGILKLTKQHRRYYDPSQPCQLVLWAAAKELPEFFKLQKQHMPQYQQELMTTFDKRRILLDWKRDPTQQPPKRKRYDLSYLDELDGSDHYDSNPF